MKHLKKFKNNNINFKTGDFIIWQGNDFYLEILEIIRIELSSIKNKYWSRIIYTYNSKKGLVFQNQTSEAFFTDVDLEDVKYISNNIEDCIKNIDVIYDSNKFNL